MRPCLIDADAFIHLRTLSFLEIIRGLEQPTPRIVFTDRLARHDLLDLAPLLRELETAGVVSVVGHVPARRGTYFSLVKSGVDKGEASAIAWLRDDATDAKMPFVSCDRRARQETLRQRLVAWDLFDLVVALVSAGDVSRADAQSKLARWDDRAQQLGRPSDYDGFDASFERRSARLA